MQYAEYRKNDVEQRIVQMGAYPLDVMLVGATGSGKSSTINCLTGSRLAKTSGGADPETMDIQSYTMNRYFRLWDTPGLGDSPDQDQRHLQKMRQLLGRKYKTNDTEYRLIDLAMLILDGGQRDLLSAVKVLNELIIPVLGADRVILAVNQADRAMKGRYWDRSNQSAAPELKSFLERQTMELHQRLQNCTGHPLPVPICYSATAQFRISDLLDQIIQHVPKQRQAVQFPQTSFSLCGFRLPFPD
jgi:predicted GTPase